MMLLPTREKTAILKPNASMPNYKPSSQEKTPRPEVARAPFLCDESKLPKFH